MTKLKRISKVEAKAIGKEVEKALQPIAAHFGIKLEMRGGIYEADGSAYRPKIQFSLAEVDGQSVEQLRFNEVCELYGLKESDFGRHFKSHSGQGMTLTGVHPRSSKFPFLAKGDNGKTYKCKMTLEDADTLELRGYLGMALFGQTTTWTRVQPDESAPAE